jgi:hypothetical protein
MTVYQPDTPDTEQPGASHASLGIRILLADPADLKQRDVERLMREFNKQPGGTSQPEYDGKMLRAALMCGDKWVKEIEPAITPKDVDGLAPNKVRWFTRQIDALYQEVTAIPLV